MPNLRPKHATLRMADALRMRCCPVYRVKVCRVRLVIYLILLSV